MWEYGIEYAGESEKENGLSVVRRPNIPAPERRYERKKIPGRDGEIYITNGELEDIEIDVELNYIGKPDEWFKRFRRAKKWLLQKGQHRLVFGDNMGFFYLAKKVVISEADRVCHEIGKFTATFTCGGYEYVLSGQQEYAISDVTYNPYSISHPTYMITGEGTCILTVNGNTMSADIGQNITIDTELMIAYRQDGEMQNTEVTGKYEDLYLIEGENAISVTDGFEIKIIPNWRCE